MNFFGASFFGFFETFFYFLTGET